MSNGRKQRKVYTHSISQGDPSAAPHPALVAAAAAAAAAAASSCSKRLGHTTENPKKKKAENNKKKKEAENNKSNKTGSSKARHGQGQGKEQGNPRASLKRCPRGRPEALSTMNDTVYVAPFGAGMPHPGRLTKNGAPQNYKRGGGAASGGSEVGWMGLIQNTPPPLLQTRPATHIRKVSLRKK